jgi:hypothetical protein
MPHIPAPNTNNKSHAAGTYVPAVVFRDPVTHRKTRARITTHAFTDVKSAWACALLNADPRMHRPVVYPAWFWRLRNWLNPADWRDHA